MIYYQNIDSLDHKEMSNSFEIKIQPDDLLMITVSCEDPEIAKPFNANYSLSQQAGQSASLSQQTGQSYLVDVNGVIDFPVLGKLKIGGLSRTELMKMLSDKISLYIKKPTINLTIMNYKVTVQGEVASPGTYPFTSERFTLIEALIKAGDLTLNGIRKNILIIRQRDGVITYNRVDITKADFISSPFYYLAQNDVVYVEPNRARINKAVIGPNRPFIISAATLLITFIITSIIRK